MSIAGLLACATCGAPKGTCLHYVVASPAAAPAVEPADRAVRGLRALRTVLGIDSPETRGWAPAVQQEARRAIDRAITALAPPAAARVASLDERAEFEKWVDIEAPSIHRQTTCYGDSHDEESMVWINAKSIAWMAWQARAAMAPIDTPVPVYQAQAPRAETGAADGGEE